MKKVTAAVIRDGDKILICQRAAYDECGKLKLNVHNAAEWVTLQEIGSYEFMPADVGLTKIWSKYWPMTAKGLQLRKNCATYYILSSEKSRGSNKKYTEGL